MTRTVIVVDDHPSFRRCVRTLLVLEGFEVLGELSASGSKYHGLRTRKER